MPGWPWKKQVEGAADAAGDEAQKKELDEFVGKLTASFSQAVEEKLKPIHDKVEGLEARWGELERSAQAQGDQGGNGQGQELTGEEKDRLEKSKLLAITIATNARITESEVLAEIKDKFPNFVAKVKEYFETTPLERKGQADYSTYCRNVVKMVIGDAALAGGLKFDGANNRFFLEDAGASNNQGETYEFLSSDLNWTDKNGRTITPREQLSRLGIQPEEFQKSVKGGVV